jgi:site-specific recombinase XerD
MEHDVEMNVECPFCSRTNAIVWPQDAGLPVDRRHPHCLKHALGFALVASKLNLAIVKQALGHKNIASKASYAVPTDEQTGRSVNAGLAGLF